MPPLFRGLFWFLGLSIAGAMGCVSCGGPRLVQLSTRRFDLNGPVSFSLARPFRATGRRTLVCVVYAQSVRPAGNILGPDGSPMRLVAKMTYEDGQVATFDRVLDKEIEGRWMLCTRELPSVRGRRYTSVSLEGTPNVTFYGAWLITER
jgi:hypothetical protein